LIGCPKLDSTDYSDKLSEILKNNTIKRITVVRMEVPCCGGLITAVEKALQISRKSIPYQKITLSKEGQILFAFSKGEEISAHDSKGDAFVHVLEGTGKFTVGGVEHFVHAGEALVMPAKIPHAVYGEEDFKWILTVIFP